MLIARVRELASPEEIERRYGAINEFEAELVDEGTTIIKVMLHISPEEQKTRLLDRLERPEKQWKYNPSDVDERMLGPQVPGGVPDRLRSHVDAASPRGTSCRPTASGTRGSRCSTCSSRRSRRCELEWPKPDYDVETEKARLLAS